MMSALSVVGTFETCRAALRMSADRGYRTWSVRGQPAAIDPTRTLGRSTCCLSHSPSFSKVLGFRQGWSFLWGLNETAAVHHTYRGAAAGWPFAASAQQ